MNRVVYKIINVDEVPLKRDCERCLKVVEVVEMEDKLYITYEYIPDPDCPEYIRRDV